MNQIDLVEKEQERSDIPDFRIGDTVEVHYKVIEGGRERIQIFKGVVIGIKSKGLSKSFTVRKVSFGIGVEKIFPLHSPKINKIEITRHGKVRRSKLYYLRDRIGKKARVKERRD